MLAEVYSIMANVRRWTGDSLLAPRGPPEFGANILVLNICAKWWIGCVSRLRYIEPSSGPAQKRDSANHVSPCSAAPHLEETH